MPELVAVVDLGSTAVRLLLARIASGSGYRVLVEERVPTRLGGGVPGRLPRAAIDKTLRAVHRFFARYTSKSQGPRIVAVATSAVRDATNRERLLGPLRRLEGVEVQVLSARDEARLGVDAALNRLRFKSGIVADLGGASLQLSRVHRRKVASITSLPLGAVRTTRRFLRHDPPRPRELRALRHEVRRHLDGAMPPAGRRDVLVALGGTVRTLASIHLRAHPGERKHRNGLQLWQSDITAIRERLEGLSPRKHRKIRGLTAERADIILAGAIVIEEVMVFGGYLTLAVCSSGVRDGVLLRETFPRGRESCFPRPRSHSAPACRHLESSSGGLHVKDVNVPLIAIVDDDASVRRSLHRLVQTAGYPVETFASAREFLEWLPRGRAACLVLDVHMNGLSGFELQERLAVPVIFITAHDDATTRERIEKSGAAGALQKPFDEQAVLTAIRKAVAANGDAREPHPALGVDQGRAAAD